jgi:hypothetical protein
MATEQAQNAATAQKLIEQVTEKLRNVVREFAAGEISQEQFHGIYEHYQGQMLLAAQMASEADLAAQGTLPTPGETIGIRSRLTAKARAMAIFYYGTGMLLETLGGLDIPIAETAPILNEIRQTVRQGINVDVRTERLDKEWLLFVPGLYSVSVMLFSHQPATRQIEMIQNMHRDFEKANEGALKSGSIDGSKLAYPFQTFVQRSVAQWTPRPVSGTT